MKKLWHWLTFPKVLNDQLQRTKGIMEFYERAYFETKHQLFAREAQLVAARRHLDAFESRSKQGCRRGK